MLTNKDLPWMGFIDVHLIEIFLGICIVQSYCANTTT